MKITQILGTEDLNLNGKQLKKTQFFADGQVYYTFAKIAVGEDREEESRREFVKPDGTKEITIKFKSSGGFGKFNDPQTRKEIIRQNSLTNAVNYCIAKANLEKDFKLTGKEVIQVATYFAKYSEGELTVASGTKTPTEPIVEPSKPKQTTYAPNEDEVNLDDVFGDDDEK